MYSEQSGRSKPRPYELPVFQIISAEKRCRNLLFGGGFRYPGGERNALQGGDHRSGCQEIV
ncbi:MAG TPA: hypothetical protein VHP83_21280, partial [Aggregatilineaceae bacterium]|nr:hypothetical protein [Aggregatilineaceae bacterium]